MQTSYANNPGMAFSGMIADTQYKDIISRISNTRQLLSVAVTTEANEEHFIVTIDGTAYDYTSDGNGTKAEIAAGLKALIDAGDVDATVTLFTTSEADDSFYIQNNSYDAGDELTVTITNPSTGVLTLTTLVEHGQGVPFGCVVCEDEVDSADSLTGERPGCRLPRLAADVTTLGSTLGVAVADSSKVASAGEYVAGESIPILKKGRVWMHVEDVAAVAVGGLVYVRHVAGATEQLGDIRAADDGADTDVLPFASAHFTGQKIAALNIAVVEWNL